MNRFFIMFIMFIIFLWEDSHSLGSFLKNKKNTYEVSKNTDIKMQGLIDGGKEIFLVKSIRHVRDQTFINWIAKGKNHSIKITPSIQKFQLKNITGLKMKRRIEMSGMHQKLTLLVDGKEYLIIGDDMKSSHSSDHLKGRYYLHFFRKNLEHKGFQVFIKKDEIEKSDSIHHIQAKKAIPLQIDGSRWELYIYRFRAFDLLIAKARQLNLSVENPFFSYDYILIKK